MRSRIDNNGICLVVLEAAKAGLPVKLEVPGAGTVTVSYRKSGKYAVDGAVGGRAEAQKELLRVLKSASGTFLWANMTGGNERVSEDDANEREIEGMADLLKARGFAAPTTTAIRLSKTGMGPEELRSRLRLSTPENEARRAFPSLSYNFSFVHHEGKDGGGGAKAKAKATTPRRAGGKRS